MKLLLAAMCLLLVFGLGYALIQIFVNGEEHYRAQRNFDLLIKRIDAVREEEIAWPANSLIVALPENYVILGFDAGAQGIYSVEQGFFSSLFEKLKLNRVASVAIARPKKCDMGKACLCLATLDDAKLYTMNPTAIPAVTDVPVGSIVITQNPLKVGDAELRFDIIKCRELEMRTVAGTQEHISIAVWGPDARFQAKEKQGFRNARDLVLNTQEGPANVYITVSGGNLLLDAYDPDRQPAEGGGFGGAGTTGGWQ